MTIVVGTDSYVSVDEADVYWENHNNTVWPAASDENKEKALRDATIYIDGIYEGRWVGFHPGGSSQILAWPRNGAVDSEGRSVSGIPQRVEEATSRLALEALAEFLTKAEDRGGRIESAKVGALEVGYFRDAPAGTAFPFLDLMLNSLLKPGSSTGGALVRV